jgi:uroporphyrinogen-III decarboxylase
MFNLTSKERLLAALRGEPVDYVPWSPNLAYWWEAQSDEFIHLGELEFLKKIGAEPLFRGHYPQYKKKWTSSELFKYRFKHVNEREIVKGPETITVFETPVGSLKYVTRYSASGNTSFLCEHAVKSEDDLKILTYLYEDIELEADYKTFNEEAKRLGEEGLIVPTIVPIVNKTSFQAMIEHWVGTEELAYLVADYPQAIEEALGAMRLVTNKAALISSQSDAQAFITWEDTSTTNISPAYYEKYIAPEIDGWCDILHKNDKIYIQHACGHLRALMPIIAKTKIDCIESISPPPTGNIELWEARNILTDRISLVGGIEPTVLLNSTNDELGVYAEKLYRNMGSKGFILANSDSCPPGVQIEKFFLLQKITKRL